MKECFILPVDLPREAKLAGIAEHLAGLPIDKAWRIEVHWHRRTRTNQQNRWLFGAIYPEFLKALPGFEIQDIHEFMLGECYGWEQLEGLGRKRLKPLKRSHDLSTTEFADFCEFVRRKAAEHGVVIPDPNTSEW